MNLTNLVRSGVRTAFTILQSEVKLADYVYRTSNEYSDALSGYPTATQEDVKFIESRFEYRELTINAISIRDSKFLIQADKVDKVPEEGDHFNYSGHRYDVIRLMSFPGDALLIVHVRRM